MTDLPEPTTAKPPFSKLAIAGFVISCICLFYIGFIGVIGLVLSAIGFAHTRRGRARGRGLAIAGMIIGAFGFLFYFVNFFMRGT
jgi:hypothetical protein